MIRQLKTVACACLMATLVLAGCGSPDQEVEVATIVDRPAMVDGYYNQATADYANCLEQAEITVRAETDPRANNTVGYAVVVGAAFVVNGAGDGSYGLDSPISVDGVDRDAEVRACRTSNPGAKDALLDMFDFVANVEDTPIPEGEVAAGVEWARCARAFGFAQIEDPQRNGYVAIPQEVTLVEAKMLGENCSEPMAEDEYWPQFEFRGGIEDPETGMIDLTPFAEVIDGPFLASDKYAQQSEDAASE